MTNLILFANSFLSYLVCFGVFVVAVLIAIFIGTSMRKAKNVKEMDISAKETENSESVSSENEA